MTDLFARYLEALTGADAARAVGALEQALDQGEPPAHLIRDVIAAGQRHVGERWMAGAWSIADEHAATAVAEQALAAVVPLRLDERRARRVVLACAEGEWHTFPARLAAALGRSADLELVNIGGSPPPEELERLLRSMRPDAFAMSVTMTTNLIKAFDGIEIARQTGVPVFVGGAAWGRGQRRARRLGATLHVEDAADLPGLLDNLAGQAAPTGPVVQIPAEARDLDAVRPDVVAAMLSTPSGDSVLDRMPVRLHEQTVADLGWLGRYAAAAVACGEPGVLEEGVQWLEEVLAARGEAQGAVRACCGVLAGVIERQAPLAAALLMESEGGRPAGGESPTRTDAHVLPGHA